MQMHRKALHACPGMRKKIKIMWMHGRDARDNQHIYNTINNCHVSCMSMQLYYWSHSIIIISHSIIAAKVLQKRKKDKN